MNTKGLLAEHSFDMSDPRYAVLSYEQVQRLNDVLQEILPIHGRGNFPTLEVRLSSLVSLVRKKLEADSVPVKEIRINGGAASHILTSEKQAYNDVDLIFMVSLRTAKDYDKVKTAVLDALLDFLPETASKKRMSSCAMKEGYVNKMVKVNEPDRWSLISLSNNGGRNIELKFVDTIKRQFEFSVDSFQVVLDSLLNFYDCAEMPISDSFYPTVIGESVYGDFHEALYHLQKKLIATKNPEEIRGGGLLKYCHLLVKEYKPANPDQIKNLERYMCSRFFIDFSDVSQQHNKLEAYLSNHFMGADESLRYEYLMKLHQVVDDSTVCLMGHERRQTLNLIDDLACRMFYVDQQALYNKQNRNSSKQSAYFDIHIPPLPPVIFSNGYYYAPIVPAPPPIVTGPASPNCTCSCGWLQCA